MFCDMDMQKKAKCYPGKNQCTAASRRQSLVKLILKIMLLKWFFFEKRQKKWRSVVAGGYAGTRRDGTRHQRSEVSVSIADRRARSARQPLKKSRFLHHAESNRVKRKNLKGK